MTGVSGGSLLISGFHLPQFGDSVQGTLLACGGLAPQVAVTDAAAQKLVASRLHFQSTTNGEQSRQWEPCDPCVLIDFHCLASPSLNVNRAS